MKKFSLIAMFNIVLARNNTLEHEVDQTYESEHTRPVMVYDN